MRILRYLLVLLLAQPAQSQSSAAWETVVLDQETYVTVQSVKEFYGFQALTSTAAKITLTRHQTSKNPVTITFLRGQQDAWINGVKFVLSYPLRQSRKGQLVHTVDLVKLIDPIMRPHNIGRKKNFDTVIIDPGHGGHDPGTISPHGFGEEKTHTLSLSKKLAKHLRRRGFKVRMTRDYELSLSLQQRVDFANQFENAILISIHFNAGGGGRAQGIETFTLAPKGVAHYGRNLEESDFHEKQGNSQDVANIALATAVHKLCVKNTGRRDRGIRRARYSVISGVRHPAILIECGFLANETEGRLIQSPSYQDRFAYSIAEGVVKYKLAIEGKAKPSR